MVRSNLTIYSEKGMEDMPLFYRDHGIVLVASLPYYQGEVVDRVRGEHAFEKSIRALRTLNNLGFGVDPGGLKLDLVHNFPWHVLSSIPREDRRGIPKGTRQTLRCVIQ